MRFRQHRAVLRLLSARPRAVDCDGVLRRLLALRHHGGHPPLLHRGADRRSYGGHAGGPHLPPPAQQDPSRHQGGQPAPLRERHHQAGRLRRGGADGVDHVAPRHRHRHALLDGARSHLGRARGRLQRKGGRLVARHHGHRARRGCAAPLGHAPDARHLPHPDAAAADARHEGGRLARADRRLCGPLRGQGGRAPPLHLGATLAPAHRRGARRAAVGRAATAHGDLARAAARMAAAAGQGRGRQEGQARQWAAGQRCLRRRQRRLRHEQERRPPRPGHRRGGHTRRGQGDGRPRQRRWRGGHDGRARRRRRRRRRRVWHDGGQRRRGAGQ
mmetsp:Transcript_34838/g.88389  ORF Transcript_34838/g.88389 Transcript_34838/m.88389 type:complete len:330 (+) Transcript_34838:237-1226(+)